MVVRIGHLIHTMRETFSLHYLAENKFFMAVTQIAMNFKLSENQKDLISQAREFSEREISPFAAKWDSDEHIPRTQIQKYADVGWFGMTMPQRRRATEQSSMNSQLGIENTARTSDGYGLPGKRAHRDPRKRTS